MTKFHRYKPTGIVLLFALILSLSTYAQRKKKNDEGTQASGVKLREAEFYFTEGEKFFILEDYAKAILYYQRTLELTPENGTVHYKIAEILARSSKQDDLLKASLSIEQALKLERKNKYFYLLAANIYSSLGRFDKAAQTYEALISEIKGTEEYLYELASIYQYANKPDEALKVYNRAESIMGVNEISSAQKQRILMDQGKTKEALAEGERLIEAYPGEERFVMGFAEVLSEKGMRNEAISYLEKFLQQNEDSPNAMMLLAGIYRDNNQEEKARPLLLKLFDNPDVEFSRKMLILGTYSAQISMNRSKKNADEDQEAFAFSLFNKLEQTNPTDANIHILGGDLYLSSERPREAQREYLQAIELGEVNYEVWENLLYIDMQLEQYDQAIVHADQALELYPNQRMIHYFSGYANLRKRHYKEAISSLEQAKKLSNSAPAFVSDLNALLGDAYNATKNYELSDKAYEEALAFNANNSVVLNQYSYFLALRKQNLEKAEKMSSTLVKNNPDNATFLDTYAWVLYMREKYKDARKAIERAVNSGNANATHLEHYGDILYKLGEVDNAVKQWERARGLNANSEILNKKIANRKIYE
ncbi:tetratricopeptide repeat protein [Pseudochryseolinea flava]|uniref:tetratricopeptide repeat protein n=1 Tax=Pseudochryseolinea flava TaxID=2059302 RepID=UPI001402583A|nr:tetratricopeptide repeat protein [Pseudochryseolinea flava]